MSSSRTSSVPTTSASWEPRHSEHAERNNQGATCLVEVARRQVPHPPALVGHRLPDLFQQLLFDLRGREPLRDRDEVLYRQEANGILVVALELPVDHQPVT